MSISKDDVIPESFSGIVPLFPIPNMVLFPGVVVPLHIFEKRYQKMMQWTMGHEHLIAMASFRDWDTSYQQKPPLQPIVCVGKVVAQKRLDDGRYKLFLQGGQRAFVDCELTAPQPFRTAQVRLLDDVYTPSREHDRHERFAELTRGFLNYLRERKVEDQNFFKILKTGISFGLLTDIIASVLEIDAELKYDLLQQVNVDNRADELAPRLEYDTLPFTPQLVGNRVFPPKFSDN